MRRLHILMGGLACAAFALTGMYMRIRFPELHEDHPGKRMMFRSAHVYVLLTGLAQLLLGAYWAASPTGWRALAQRVGSLLLLPTPALMLAAFIVEPSATSVARPVTLSAVVLMIGGTLLHVVARWKLPPN